jgi:hypothetical protein
VTITAHPTLALLVWSGTLGTSEDEIFSYKRHAGIIVPEDLEDVMDSAANDVTDLLAESSTAGGGFSVVGDYWHSSVAWTMLKGYIIDEATGANLSVEPAVRILTDVGTSFASKLPNQDALAITTQMFPRGRQSMNRFYLPPMVEAVMASTGHVTGEVIDDIQTQLKLANTAHKAESPSWEYGVYSTTGHNMQVIDRYHSGDVMDTIRRRRNKLIESRHNLAG